MENTLNMKVSLKKQSIGMNTTLTVGLVITTVIVIVAIFPSLFTSYSPTAQDANAMLLPPSSSHWFGTDNFGRDIFSRVVYGARIDLAIGIGATIVPFIVGTILGLLTGYYGGKLDTLLMRLLDISMAFPFMVLAVLLAAIIGSGIQVLLVASWLVAWKEYARLIRSEVMVARSAEYVEAAKSMGYGDGRIIFRHILPNVISSAIVYCASDIVISMMAAASLSFLGLGVQAPTPEWGAIISGGKSFLSSAPWITVLPGFVLAITGLGFSLIGDGLSDMLRTGGK